MRKNRKYDRIQSTMDEIIKEIVENLQKIKPLKIILFGSYAKERFDEESDIDLIVILDTDIIPQNYNQKLDLKVEVRDCIYDVSRKIPIDLVVYTNGEFELIKKNRTSFYNEIETTGKTIYEKAG